MKCPKDYDELYRLYHKHIYRFSVSKFKNLLVFLGPDDLVQEMFIKIIENKCIEKYDPSKGKFKTFLFGCLMHCGKQLYEYYTNKKHKHISIELMDWHGGSFKPDYHNKIWLDQLADNLKDKESKNTTRCRKFKRALELSELLNFYRNGWSQLDVAKEFNVTCSAIGLKNNKLIEEGKRLCHS